MIPFSSLPLFRCVSGFVGALLLLLPASSLAQTSPSTPATGSEVLERVQSKYASLDGLQATFVQRVTSEFAEGTSQLEGRLMIAPEKYRIETSEQTLVTDGQTTWVYTPQDEQVIVNDADTDPSSFSPATLFGNYADRFAVDSTWTERRRGASHDVLVLTPTVPQTTYTTMTLWVRRSDTLVTRLRVEDRSGATITIDLRDLVANPDVDAETFRFDPPDGADVVDLRSS